jgi:peroxiredoxin
MREFLFFSFLFLIVKTPAQLNTIKIGDKAPDFISLNAEGKEVSLYEIVSKSKITLLNFWASWCMPCREEIPDLKNLHKEFNHRGFSIISVSLDNNFDKWQAAINKDSMLWTHVSELNGRKETGAKLYRVNALPASVLIDSNGSIIALDLPGSGISPGTENSLKGEGLYKKVKGMFQ